MRWYHVTLLLQQPLSSSVLYLMASLPSLAINATLHKLDPDPRKLSPASLPIEKVITSSLFNRKQISALWFIYLLGIYDHWNS